VSVVVAGSGGESLGALTFERHGTEPFADDTLRLAEAVAAVLGPQIALPLRAGRFVAGRIIDPFADGCEALLGPRRPGLKLVAAGIVTMVLALVFPKGRNRTPPKPGL